MKDAASRAREADRLARQRAKEADERRAREARQARADEARELARLLSEGRTLARRAAALLLEHEFDRAESFRVRRRLRNGFAGSRPGWFVGSIVSGLGHGESGPVPIHLLSTGELVWAAWGGGSASPVTPMGLEFFAPGITYKGTSRLETVVGLLRTVVARYGEPA